jgi:hypothetical protein
MSTPYFSFSGGPGTVSTEGAPGHVTMSLYFCIWWDLQVTYCILVRPGRKMLTQYFPCSSGPSTDSTKSMPGDVTPNLCFCNRCNLWVTWCVLLHSGHETLTHHFSCSGGLLGDLLVARAQKLYRILHGPIGFLGSSLLECGSSA